MCVGQRAQALADGGADAAGDAQGGFAGQRAAALGHQQAHDLVDEERVAVGGAVQRRDQRLAAAPRRGRGDEARQFAGAPADQRQALAGARDRREQAGALGVLLGVDVAGGRDQEHARVLQLAGDEGQQQQRRRGRRHGGRRAAAPVAAPPRDVRSTCATAANNGKRACAESSSDPTGRRGQAGNPLAQLGRELHRFGAAARAPSASSAVAQSRATPPSSTVQGQKAGAPPPSQQRAQRTRAPASAAARGLSSAAKRVLPMPASPAMKNSRPRAAMASVNPACSSASSRSRPTNAPRGGSGSGASVIGRIDDAAHAGVCPPRRRSAASEPRGARRNVRGYTDFNDDSRTHCSPSLGRGRSPPLIRRDRAVLLCRSIPSPTARATRDLARQYHCPSGRHPLPSQRFRLRVNAPSLWPRPNAFLAPTPVCWLLEGRALLELAALLPAYPFLRRAPRRRRSSGAGAAGVHGQRFLHPHPAPFPARQGLPRARLEAGTQSRPERGAHRRHGRAPAGAARAATTARVSLIGWSLGGIYARELARAMPELVRQVITLASPFRDLDAVNVPRFLRRRSRAPLVGARRCAGARTPARAAERTDDGHRQPHRRHRIMAELLCRPGPLSENLEVDEQPPRHRPSPGRAADHRRPPGAAGRRVEAVRTAARLALPVRPARRGVQRSEPSGGLARRERQLGAHCARDGGTLAPVRRARARWRDRAIHADGFSSCGLCAAPGMTIFDAPGMARASSSAGARKPLS